MGVLVPLNIGYLTSDRTKEGDELYTPRYAVEPIEEYIAPQSTIWCPFDTEESMYVQCLREKHNVIYTHLALGQDFFTEDVPKCDYIISNPPFSKKFEVLERLLDIGKPFAIIFPLPSIQTAKNFDLIEQCQLLVFDRRIKFHHRMDLSDNPGSPAFASIYLCKDFLPNNLVFKRLG